MKISPFSIATDGSNDNGLLKMNPLTVRIYDVNLGKITTRFLDMCISTGGTAEELFTTIDSCLASFRGKTMLPLVLTTPMSTWARPTQLRRALRVRMTQCTSADASVTLSTMRL